MKIALPNTVEPATAYVANMRALWQHFPDIAHRIDQIDELDLIDCEPSRQGPMTCKVLGAKEQAVYLHSRYDPLREADQWAAGAEAAGAAQESVNSGQIPMCYVVDGFGLGYHVRALWQRLAGEAFMVVCEENLPLLRTALEWVDYSEMLASEQVLFLTRADREEVLERLQGVGNMMMLGTVFTRSLTEVNRSFYAAVHGLIGDFTSYMRSHMSSLVANSVVTCENVLRNLGAYVCAGTINSWRGRFAGKPAVLVAAGPSLRGQLAELKRVRERVVVIAVQTTLKPLLAYGIRPDFVTSLDYHEVSGRFFEGLTAEDLRGVTLVVEPKATWRVVEQYAGRGRMVLLGNEFARLVLGASADSHDTLRSGATVAHLSLYWAEYIGADPIVMIGQDLGYTNNVYYSPGTALHAVWAAETGRFCTVEMKEWERIVRSRKILRKVEDVAGREIYTDEQMFTYLQQFEKDIAQSSATIIDATGGGREEARGQW